MFNVHNKTFTFISYVYLDSDIILGGVGEEKAFGNYGNRDILK